MWKGLIVYQSKYGSAKKYAMWLADATGFDVVETPKADSRALKEYDRIILCGSIYASGIAGISFLRKNRQALKGKKTAVFCVGASPYDEKALEEVKEHNLKEDLKEIPMFYGRGAWDESSMSFKDRTLCKMLQKAVAKKDSSTYEPWMTALMCAVGQKCDWTDKKYLEPVIQYMNE
ncbi:MAG TPA: flavodoxin domain-containing protein [Candidatus Mediterraneibacter intestinavium]|nr:flavodoxin domain-containing protein [Candidatus Mediterraneibacter intestinavium]